MFAWVMTGRGAESTPSAFIPQQAGHAVLFSSLALATGGTLAMPMGAALMNYMGHYVGTLAAASRRPAVTALLAWHPWAVIRIVSFVVIGVVLSAPLLSRAIGFRVDWTTGRRLLLWEDVRIHLDECAPCLRQYGLEQAVKALVARCCGGDAPPADLRERVSERKIAAGYGVATLGVRAQVERESVSERELAAGCGRGEARVPAPCWRTQS